MFVSTFAEQASAQIAVKLANCEPIATEDCPGGPCATAGYGGPGYGNSAATRRLRVRLGYHLENPTDIKADAIDDTTRIEICRSTSQTEFACPGTGSWLLFDRASGVGSIDANKVYANFATTQPLVTTDLDLDWESIGTAGTHLFVAINGFVFSPGIAAAENGACHQWRITGFDASDTRFRVFGVDPLFQPTQYGAGFDVCTDGSKINWTSPAFGPTKPGRNICTSPSLGEYVRQIMNAQDDSQNSRIQRSLAPPIIASRNGQFSPGNYGPHRVFLGPHFGGYGQAAKGAYYLNVDSVRNVDPTQPASVALKDDANDVMGKLTHEYYHSLQDAWGRERPLSNVHINGFTSESMATSVDINLCLETFPNEPATANLCVSAGKLGRTSSGMYSGAKALAADPSVDLLMQAYTSAAYWRYLQEQFSYDVDTLNNAHTAGPNSLILREPNADLIELVARPFSDQGIDLIGRLYDTYAGASPGFSTLDILSLFLLQNLGRALSGTVADFHTALVLKDYTDTDERWRFDWVHGDGYKAKTLLRDAKPFPVPTDLYGPTCNPAKFTCDGLNRAKRLLDSWETSPSGPVRKLLSYPAGISAVQPATLSAYGAAYLSVSPDITYAGKDLWVFGELLSGKPAPRFRVFAIDELTPGALVPRPVCGTSPGFYCPLTQGSGQPAQKLAVGVPITAATREVIVIASGGSSSAIFDWRFSSGSSRLEILEPTSMLPEQIGISVLRQAFLAKVSYRDPNNLPVPVTKSKVSVELPGCGSTDCQLSPSEFQLLPLSGGHFFVVGSLPASKYPSGSGKLDLRVRVGTDSAESPASVGYGSPRTEVHVLALDASGSMVGPKLQAAQLVSGALLSSIAPPTPTPIPLALAGLVTFNQDAVPLLPGGGLLAVSATALPQFESALAGITAAGGTSIGDGVYESQSLIAAAYDGKAVAPEFVGITVLSDGKNTDPATPKDYYGSAGTAPSNDGAGPPWHTQSPLRRRERKLGNLSLPRISSVSIGADADVVEMALLAKNGAGVNVWIPGPELGVPLYRITTEMGDALFTALNENARFERIQSARPAGPGTALQFPVESASQVLRVNAVSDFDNAVAEAVLLSPDGQVTLPAFTADSARSASFTIEQPAPGVWQLDLPLAPAVAQSVFAEASALSPSRFFATADVEDVEPVVDGQDPTPEQSSGQVGAPVYLRGLTWRDGALGDCQVSARVAFPFGSASTTLQLSDDGQHADGAADDGVFGAVFTSTGSPGIYPVRFASSCQAPNGELIARERLTSFVLALSPSRDLNANGILDSWEDFYGAGDAGDSDADGLANIAEFQNGTSPLHSDSDGGGESDGSELTQGRDPNDASDDALSTPVLVARAGNAMVGLEASMNTAGLTLTVQTASSEAGPFTPLMAAAANGSVVDGPAENDARRCYRARIESSAATSGWSNAACATPRLDPIAPVISSLLASTRIVTREVEVQIVAHDLASDRHEVEPRFDFGVVPSGVTDMRIAYGPVSELGMAPWQAFEPTLSLRLPDAGNTQLQVQVRDLAGNLSEPSSLLFIRREATDLAKAVSLEERAEDALALGDIAGARQEVLASLLPVKLAMKRAVGELSHAHGAAKKQWLHAVVSLAHIFAKKTIAHALLKPHTRALGRHALSEALRLERELLVWADRNGLTL